MEPSDKELLYEIVQDAVWPLLEQANRFRVAFQNRVPRQLSYPSPKRSELVSALTKLLRRALDDTPSQGTVKIGAEQSMGQDSDGKGHVTVVIRFGSRTEYSWGSDATDALEQFKQACRQLRKLGVDLWENRRTDDRDTYHLRMVWPPAETTGGDG